MPTITKEVNIDVEIDADDLSDMDQDDLVGFIKEIDSSVSDWEFTERLVIEFFTLMFEDGHEDRFKLLEKLQEIAKEDEESVDKDDDDNEDDSKDAGEDEKKKEADPAQEEHPHVFRSGKCYCGATA